MVFLQKEEYGPIWKTYTLANHKARGIRGLKFELLKWVANDLCEPIAKLINLVTKEGFSSFTDRQQHLNDLQIWWKTLPEEL